MDIREEKVHPPKRSKSKVNSKSILDDVSIGELYCSLKCRALAFALVPKNIYSGTHL